MEPSQFTKPVTSRGIVSWAIKGALYKLFVAAILMLSAGRWDWGMGWLYVAIFLLFDAATAIVVLPRSPALLIERSGRQPGTAGWDKFIMPVAAGLLPMLSWIVAGLDERFGWLPEVGSGLQVGATVATVVGHAIVVWAMGANAFFSAVVRVQVERGHEVASGGPYRWIRHPGYIGAILFAAAVPLMLGSWWALIPGLAGVVLYVVRTALEDKYLVAELNGYREYAARVKYRLLPGIW
jgi:protein-S-isoprenylcysteine O-methyltransferase Ste14